MKETFGNSGGEGGFIFLHKNGNSREVGGSSLEFPPWWGYGYFLELHITFGGKEDLLTHGITYLVLVVCFKSSKSWNKNRNKSSQNNVTMYAKE